MANQVSLQSDVGALGLAGLGAFSNFLAAASADNVAPMAMVALEHLGAAFHINGPYATRLPELLTRYSAHPVGRLALLIGWRRGDTVSYFADTAAGQAASMLSFCLANMYNSQALGDILSRLCSTLVPPSLPRASPAHLADVATLVSSKVDRMGFGNILAVELHRILSVYEQLGEEPPTNLVETPSIESIVYLFDSLSNLTKDGYIIRAIGSFGMAYILAIVTVMFPYDMIVTVESLIICDNQINHKIVIEISASETTRVQVGKKVQQAPYVSLPLEAPPDHMNIAVYPCLFFEGWLARQLELEYGRFGLFCTQSVRVAFCNILVCLAPIYRSNPLAADDLDFTRGITALLGSYPHIRTEQVCQRILLASPTISSQDFETAWEAFTSVLEQSTKTLRCTCSKRRFRAGWPKKAYSRGYSVQSSCSLHNFWEIIEKVLNAGLLSFLIDAHDGVVFRLSLSNVSTTVAKIVRRQLGSDEYVFLQTEYFLSDVFRLFAPTQRQDLRPIMGQSSGASTLFPMILKTLAVDHEGAFGFELCEGRFIFEDHYHLVLTSDAAPPRKRSKLYAPSKASEIIPSNSGEHKALDVVVRQGYNELLLQLSAQTSGSYLRIDAASVVWGYMSLERSRPCEHQKDCSLNEKYKGMISLTDVAMPRAAGRKISIIMTRGNAEAQFLCCGSERGAKRLFLYDCCLNCGVEQAGDKINILIVS